MRDTIISELQSTVRDHGGTALPQLADQTVLLESGLDSLGFAVLVSRLEDELGYDPFSLAEDAFYPITFGEFVRFYEENQPS
ncbi:MAG TPA: acyl carrier protein [Sphingomicrobium sp.]|nr:acyl carrier protein [Sphingomicrobium sp.]